MALGVGTERVEEEVKKKFPSARVARLDTDIVTKATSYYQILESFAKREIDILIGTQMIAKGLHLPHVTLVGVVNADTALHLPDFRAAERTYQVLAQVAGRSGRGDHPGEVIIQTYRPTHNSVEAVRRQDPEVFYGEEITLRRSVGYPPFAHMIRLGIMGRHLEAVQKAAGVLVEKLEQEKHGGDVLGPAPASLGRMKNQFRYQIWLRHPALPSLRSAVHATGVYDGLIRDGIRYTVDVDPLMVM